MFMRDKQNRPWKAAAAILALTACIALVAGGFPRAALLDWARDAALLSAGMRRPEGGAVALSERLDNKHYNNGSTAGTSSTSTGTGTTQSSTDDRGEQNPPPTAAAATPATVPPKKGDGGLVKEMLMSIGSNFVQGVAVKNKSGKSIDVARQIAVKPNITIKNTRDPQVLIVHTHTTESYMPYYAGYYNAGDAARTTDESKNVCAVGEAIAAQLRGAGIGVIHDTTVHDHPYTGAYTRSLATVEKVMKSNPSIQVVLDIHRDGIMLDSTTKVKPTVTIGGKKAAQLMIIAGVVSTSSNPHPDWQENLRFALRLQSALHTKYEGLVRPLSITASRYNQHVSHGALLIEMGSEGNTMEEAVYSGQLLGKTLVEVLGALKG